MLRISLLYIVLIFLSCDVNNEDKGIIYANLKIASSDIDNVNKLEGLYTLKNNSEQDVTFYFGDSCQFDFKIYKQSEQVFALSNRGGCYQYPTTILVRANTTKRSAFAGIYDFSLAPGKYTIKAYLIGYEDEVFATKSFSVN